MKFLAAALVLCLAAAPSMAKEYSSEEMVRLTAEMAKVAAEAGAVRMEAICKANRNMHV